MIIVMMFMFLVPTCSLRCPASAQLKTNHGAQGSDEFKDEIDLTCTVEGVSKDRLEYHWWLIHGVNEPIYIFSEVFGNSGVQPDYLELVVDEKHSSSIRTDFQTTITLRLLHTQADVYRCEFVLKNGSRCKRIVTHTERGFIREQDIKGKNIQSAHHKDTNDRNESTVYTILGRVSDSNAREDAQFPQPLWEPWEPALNTGLLTTIILVILIILMFLVMTFRKVRTFTLSI